MATLGVVLSVLGGLAALFFSVQILIAAFKTSVGWGFASLLLPFAVLVYVAKHWAATRTPFLRLVGATVLVMIGSGLGVASAFTGATH